jgi:hypothetical protein
MNETKQAYNFREMQARIRFLQTLSTLSQAEAEHLLRIETAEELNALSTMANERNKLIIAGLLNNGDHQ